MNEFKDEAHPEEPIARSVLELAAQVLSGGVGRADAARTARDRLGLSNAVSETELDGLLMLAAADRQDKTGRWVIDLAQVAEWRSTVPTDPETTHWWSEAMPGLNTTNLLQAEGELRAYVDESEELVLSDPRFYFSPKWTHDRAEVVLKSLVNGVSALDPDEAVVAAASIEEISDWLRWRQPDVVGRLVERSRRLIEAINTHDANALFMMRASDDLSGESIARMMEHAAVPVRSEGDLRVRISEALGNYDEQPVFVLPLRDEANDLWTLVLRLHRDLDGGIVVRFEALVRA